MLPEIYFHFRSYDGFGGERNLSLIAGLLEGISAGLEPQLRAIEITAWFATNRPPRRTLESLYHDFNHRLERLPLAKFHPTKAKLTIDFRSEVGTAEEVLRKYEINYSLFVSLFDELERVLAQLQPVLRKKKGLQSDQLVDWLRRARSSAPSSQQELEAFDASERKRRTDENATRTPWQVLGLDWDDYHPNARQVLNDPFYWEVANDFAPNGNDTGADLLDDVRSDPGAPREPLIFLHNTFHRWGIAESIEAALHKPVEAWDDQDEIAIVTHDEAVIALPFALVKVYGYAAPPTVELALQAILRQRAAAPLRGWNQSSDYAAASNKIEGKLRELLAG